MKINKDIIPLNSTIIVGFSGGPDSLYLLHALYTVREEKKLTLIAAHLNHEWRMEANNDVIFCKKVCSALGITFISKTISELKGPIKKSGSKEDVARQWRQIFLMNVMQEQKADYIALGHHADDQLETFFIRLIRGTTPSGLQCIKERSDVIIRPLLSLKKTDILKELENKKISYLTDSTNESEKHLRNRIRLTLVPALEATDQRAKANILRLIKATQENEHLVEEYANNVYLQVIPKEKIDLKRFKMLSKALQKKIVSLWLCRNAFTFTLTESFINEALRFLLSHRGGIHNVSTWSIIKKQNNAWIINNH